MTFLVECLWRLARYRWRILERLLLRLPCRVRLYLRKGPTEFAEFAARRGGKASFEEFEAFRTCAERTFIRLYRSTFVCVDRPSQVPYLRPEITFTTNDWKIHNSRRLLANMAPMDFVEYSIFLGRVKQSFLQQYGNAASCAEVQ